ncbi:MAG: hypothetical protein QOE45_527 [Frankiaceae bacterium]|jgi:hypothetical protein|nr:hypothetical protein [Frankiaceae bacterium]
MTARSLPWRRPSPVVPLGRYGGLKDPCVTRVGDRWHLFATGCHEGYRYDLVHAVAPRPGGPWTPLPPVEIRGAHGPSRCAPGVVAEGDRLHLFLQEAYNLLGGTITHLVSDDGGATFDAVGTALASLPGTTEAGLYDAHPCEVEGERYLVYAGMSTVGEPDLHLARAADWAGPWKRLGVVLGHDDVACHNPRGCPAYEWGLEGGQLAELPDGRTLLAAVCFLPEGAEATRQRVLLAVADEPTGPYDVIGPALDPAAYGRTGENGHPAVAVHRGRVHLFFQHRDGDGLPWQLYATSVSAAAFAAGNVERLTGAA